MAKSFKKFREDEWDGNEWDNDDYEDRKKDRKMKNRRQERLQKVEEKLAVFDEPIEE